MVLFAPFFSANSSERQKELETCLALNIHCDLIRRIILLIDDGCVPATASSKVEIVRLGTRPTYRDWIDLTRTICPSSDSILANSDISFDASVSQLHTILRAKDGFVCLSRCEKAGNSEVPHPSPHWSQDVWALGCTRMLPESLYKCLDIPLGVPRCDNKVAYLFAIHGWPLFNPVRFVKALHHHESQLRHYNKQLDTTILGGVVYAHPSESLLEPSLLDFDIWSKSIDRVGKVSFNRSLAKHLKSAFHIHAPSLDRTFPDSGERTMADSPNTHLAWPITTRARELRLLKSGETLLQHNRRFTAIRNGDTVMMSDTLVREKTSLIPAATFASWSAQDPPTQLLSNWIPPVLEACPATIRSRPHDSEDALFWQYPCLTEKQAYDNHLKAALGKNVDREMKIVHIYVGLPWATFIDTKTTPALVLRLMRPRLLGYRNLAETYGFKLAVHTVCQSIHWRRLLDTFQLLGITDLHISHCEKTLHEELSSTPIRIHSWPLYAVNFENSDRRKGLIAGKAIGEKRFWVSFIGAHMKHYRSDVRVRIANLQNLHQENDILIELGDTWHFNPTVFGEQVEKKTRSREDILLELQSANRYNEILSDSVFSICPEGAGPNTLRFWESLAIGAIPVVISDAWHPPHIELNGKTLEDCFIRIQTNQTESLIPLLRSVDGNTIAKMQKDCIRFYQKAAQLTCF
jgi:hypothetical protein